MNPIIDGNFTDSGKISVPHLKNKIRKISYTIIKFLIDIQIQSMIIFYWYHEKRVITSVDHVYSKKVYTSMVRAGKCTSPWLQQGDVNFHGYSRVTPGMEIKGKDVYTSMITGRCTPSWLQGSVHLHGYSRGIHVPRWVHLGNVHLHEYSGQNRGVYTSMVTTGRCTSPWLE